MRTRLPDRRRSITRSIEWRGHQFDVCVGFDGIEPREIFADGPKGQIQATIDDACVLASLALQTGLSLSDLAHSMTKEPAWTSEGMATEPASPIGAVINALVEWEQEGWAA